MIYFLASSLLLCRADHYCYVNARSDRDTHYRRQQWYQQQHGREFVVWNASNRKQVAHPGDQHFIQCPQQCSQRRRGGQDPCSRDPILRQPCPVCWNLLLDDYVVRRVRVRSFGNVTSFWFTSQSGILLQSLHVPLLVPSFICDALRLFPSLLPRTRHWFASQNTYNCYSYKIEFLKRLSRNIIYL